MLVASPEMLYRFRFVVATRPGRRGTIMKKIRFENVDLVLGDSNTMVRQGLKGALFTRGFRDIIDTDRLEVLREAVSDHNVDILICGSELVDGDTCSLAHDIRHNRVGKNPFTIIIMLIDSPDKQTIMKAINSGSDDVILKPLSAAKLFERIDVLARNRKRFVVTTDYIGPNRRDGQRPGAMVIPDFDVPNPVKVKVEGKASDEALQDVIDRFTSMVNQQKMERYAFQIGYLVERIVPLYEDGTADMAVVQHLDRLEFVARDLSRRTMGTSFDHIKDLCESIAAVATAIRKTPLKPEPRDIKLLPQLAQAISRAFAEDDKAAAVAQDISETVKKRGH